MPSRGNAMNDVEPHGAGGLEGVFAPAAARCPAELVRAATCGASHTVGGCGAAGTSGVCIGKLCKPGVRDGGVFASGYPCITGIVCFVTSVGTTL